MDERAALRQIAGHVPAAGDDAAVVDGQVLTTDMLHETTDFPEGTTQYTAGWRAVGASLSDVAAMGGTAVAAVAAYGAPALDEEKIAAFVDGASDVCERVGAAYVGGDLDVHEEWTVATTALGAVDEPVCVTGTLGRSGAACRLFAQGDHERANDLFQFEPRVDAGRALAADATAMIDSSDGLARSLHQLAKASDCGFAIESPLPVDSAVDAVATSDQDRRELACFFGEDFELVCTLPVDRVAATRERVPISLTRVGTATDEGVTLDGESLPDRGYTHG
jgi:thiamine-monophosphate kinase